MIRFQWSIDDIDGHVFKRFTRVRPPEVWLVGIERSDIPEHNVGRYVISHDGEHLHEAKMVCLVFCIHPTYIDQAQEIIASMRLFFPSLPCAELLEALWSISSPPGEGHAAIGGPAELKLDSLEA